MGIEGILSGLFAGIIIGLIARILVPTMQPVGCLLTIFIGVLGAGGGLLIGQAAGWGFLLTFITQIVIATILVAIVAALFRKSSP